MINPRQRGGFSSPFDPKLILAAIIVVGAALRLWQLGALGIIADENISILAVDGILAHGSPLLPSGMIYLRLGWFGYVIAAFAELFGREELWLRMPAVLFGIAVIPLAYWFAARLFNRPIALVVAALVALSPAEIEIARLVRMYAPFAFFYLATVLVVYRRYVEHSTRSSWLPLALALVSVITHQLGFSLAIVFLVPLLVMPQTSGDRLRLLASSVVTGVSFVAWDAIIARYMSIHVPPVVATPGAEAAAGGLAAQLLSPVAKILGQLAVPPVDFAAHLATAGSAASLVVAGALLLLVASVVAYLHRRAPWPVAAVALLCVAACALHQVNVAVALFVAYVVVARQGIRVILSWPGIALIATVVLAFAAWLGYAYAFTEPNAVAAAGISTHLRQSIRTLLDFPQYNVMWGFFFEMPLAGVAAALGILWCLDGAARPEPDRARTFLLYVFLLPLLVSGSVGTTYRELRYIMHFDVMFVTFIALGIWQWRAVLAALGLEVGAASHATARGWLRGGSLGTAALALLAFCYSPGPIGAWLTVDRGHGAARGVEALFRLPFHPDYRTPAAYVKEHRDPTREPLITLQPREFYPYVGDVDYWLTTHAFEIENHAYAVDGRRRDLYVDATIISTLAELLEVLAQSPGPVWLITSAQIVASRNSLSDDLTAFIEGRSAEIVYTGLDDDAHVYRLTSHGH